MGGPPQDRPSREGDGALSSESLAELIVDALIDAAVLDKKDLALAIAVAAEEIEAREALGDSGTMRGHPRSN
jgi:hypothetical protein